MPNTVYELADELFDEYKDWFRNDYVVWGHSMGSTVGYEVAKRCEEIRYNPPIAFFSSGASAPCNPTSSKVRLSIDSDKDFEELMEQYGGIRDELRHDKDFCDYFYPIIRGDMKIFSDYRDDEYQVAYGALYTSDERTSFQLCIETNYHKRLSCFRRILNGKNGYRTLSV